MAGGANIFPREHFLRIRGEGPEVLVVIPTVHLVAKSAPAHLTRLIPGMYLLMTGVAGLIDIDINGPMPSERLRIM